MGGVHLQRTLYVGPAEDPAPLLPAFQPNPLGQDDSLTATGHIDVAFVLTKYGRGRDVEIRDAANVSAAAQEHVTSLIRRSRFRPQLSNGEFAAETPVAFRYYVYENEQRR